MRNFNTCALGCDGKDCNVRSLTRRVEMGWEVLMDDQMIMPDPVAFFITWPTYGTWLPGDERGWVEYRHGWQLPNPFLEQFCKTHSKEEQCLLTTMERKLVMCQIVETCNVRRWVHFASDCRSNHVHLVIGAPDTKPQKIRADIKAWCTRRLREQSRPERTHWWAERGSIRYVWNNESLATVIQYVTEAQDRKDISPSEPSA